MNKLYKQLKDQGLQLIAVNDGDDAGTIQHYVKEGGFVFPIVMNGRGENDAMEKFGVMAYPTNYILDADGKVVTSLVGFDEEAMIAALKKLGFNVK